MRRRKRRKRRNRRRRSEYDCRAHDFDHSRTEWCGCDRKPGLDHPRRSYLLHRRWKHAHFIFAAVPGAVSGGVESHSQGDCHSREERPARLPARRFTLNIPSGTLVWSDEFTNSTAALRRSPIPQSGPTTRATDGFGNNELENYCAWGSSTSPCSTANPSEYVGTGLAILHIVAQQPSPGVYTSARLKTQGLFSFQYGRIEFRAQVPEAQGFWPADWLLGNNIATVSWPACGERMCWSA